MSDLVFALLFCFRCSFPSFSPRHSESCGERGRPAARQGRGVATDDGAAADGGFGRRRVGASHRTAGRLGYVYSITGFHQRENFYNKHATQFLITSMQTRFVTLRMVICADHDCLQIVSFYYKHATYSGPLRQPFTFHSHERKNFRDWIVKEYSC